MSYRKVLDAAFIATGATFVFARLGFLGWNRVPVESYKDLFTTTAQNKNFILCNRVTLNHYYIDDEASTYEHKYYIRPPILLERYYDNFYHAKK